MALQTVPCVLTGRLDRRDNTGTVDSFAPRVQTHEVQPLQDLLHRIRWDPVFGAGDFALSYYDRVARQEVVVPFSAVQFDPTRPGTLTVSGDEGVAHIPLHRVRTVHKNGAVIWQRPSRTTGE